MTLRKVLVAILLLTLATAGCVDTGKDLPSAQGETGNDPGGLASTPTDDPASEPTPRYPAPRWSPGLWWTYELSGPDGTSNVTFAVAHSNATHHHVATTDARQAAYEAIFDLPYLGTVRAQDLAGVQEDHVTELFQWPLEDGRSWTTRWGRANVTVEATQRIVDTPVGPRTGFTLTATEGDGTVHARYAYAPAAAWFTHLELPQRNVTYTLQEAGFGAPEGLLEANATTALRLEPPGGAHAGTFDVPPDGRFVVPVGAGGGVLHTWQWVLTDPNGTAHRGEQAPCLGCGGFDATFLPGLTGSWQAEVSGGPPATGSYELTVHVVTVEALAPGA